jgi:hypothetical protein
MPTKTLLSASLAAIVLLGGCEVPPPRHGDAGWRDRDRHEHENTRVAFSDRDRAQIRDYYGQRRRSLPPGLARKGNIPPGHERQMGEGGVPPGQQVRYLPYELEQRLQPLPQGYVHVIVDTDVVIMNTRTHAIVDVMRGIADD